MRPELVPVHPEKPPLLSLACSRSQMRIIVRWERRTNKTAFDALLDSRLLLLGPATVRCSAGSAIGGPVEVVGSAGNVCPPGDVEPLAACGSAVIAHPERIPAPGEPGSRTCALHFRIRTDVRRARTVLSASIVNAPSFKSASKLTRFPK